MLRKIVIAAMAVMLLAGCEKEDEKDNNIVHMKMPVPTNMIEPGADHTPPPPFVPPPDIVIQTDAPNALFSLKHDLTVEMARDAVTARFAAARDACLKDKALHCVLTSASLTTGDAVRGELQVALPHEQVAAFEKRLMKPLKQDGDRGPDITSRSTTVENETARVADVERQLKQAIVYRDKLEDLAKRPNLTVEEVLKIHEALSEAQTAVENALAAERAAEGDVRLEKMDITLEERPVVTDTGAFDGFWTNAGDIFMASLAAMLLRIVNALPWLPLALVLTWLAARFVKRLRLRRGG